MEDGGLDACRAGTLGRPLRCSRHSEDGLEESGIAERERVQASVSGGRERDRTGRRGQPVEGGGGDQGAVRHDDEHAVAGARVGERGRDRARVTPARIHQDVHTRRRDAGLRRDDERPRDGRGRRARREHVCEHPEDKRAALLPAEERREPALRPVEALHRNDREHAARIRGSLAGMAPRSIVVLAGGLGGSRLVDSLARAAGPEAVTAIVNVGDDLKFLGLYVSPDLDTVLYTLAGLLDEERGWGIRDESYAAIGAAERLGAETWFTLGDRDLGLHLVRTGLLRGGSSLSAVTARLAEALGVGVRLLPATDDRLRTFVSTPAGELDFQTWFVRRRHADPVLAVRFEGAETARPAPGVLDAIAAAELVVIAPSNPFVSIGPILAVPGLREALAQRRVAAVSPLVGGKALRGPLAEMLASLGHEPTARGVAAVYGDLVSTFVLDPADAALAPAIPGAVVAPTVMVEPGSRREVGRAVLEALA